LWLNILSPIKRMILYVGPQLCNMLTNFHILFTIRQSSKLAVKWLLKKQLATPFYIVKYFCFRIIIMNLVKQIPHNSELLRTQLLKDTLLVILSSFDSLT